MAKKLLKKAKKLSQKAKETYIKLGGVRCPHCLSDRLQNKEVYREGNFFYQDVECSNCGETWSDQYTLTNIETTETDDEKG